MIHRQGPRALQALEDSSQRIAGMIEDGFTEGAWPSAVAGGHDSSPITFEKEQRCNTMMELRAEIAQQESCVIASERARQESVQHIEKVAYYETEATQERIMPRDHQIRQQERIMHRDHQIRQQGAVIQGQGATTHEMTIEDERATYGCE